MFPTMTTTQNPNDTNDTGNRANASQALRSVRALDYPQLDDSVYLDCAGAIPPPARLISAHLNSLTADLHGNPHSLSSPSSSRTKEIIDSIRIKLLDYLGASPSLYDVIFTSNATAALKLVAESIDWSTTPSEEPNSDAGAQFWYLNTSHTSVVGMRELVRKARTPIHDIGVRAVSTSNIENFLAEAEISHKTDHTRTNLVARTSSFNLFAFPAQCNHSGIRYPLDWIARLKSLSPPPVPISGIPSTDRWMILVDASSYASTTRFDLSAHPADFLVLSFYKMFGYPTGLGALIVRKTAASVLRPTYFGGGNVSAVTLDHATESAYAAFSYNSKFRSNSRHLPKSTIYERFEFGTLPFLEILSLRHGFEYIENKLGGWESVSDHVLSLAEVARKRMKNLHHDSTNRPVCRIYEDDLLSERFSLGPIINFNVLNDDGSVVGHSIVMKLAIANKISLRAGCFCNPGACEATLGFTSEDVIRNAQGSSHHCWDEKDILDNHAPAGSLRISLGFLNTPDDIDGFLNFLTVHFRQSSARLPGNGANMEPVSDNHQPIAKLARITVYPVKSCAGYEVTGSWPVTSAGLLHDREWILVSTSDGRALTQRRFPRMCLIRPVAMNWRDRVCVFEAPGMKTKAFLPLVAFTSPTGQRVNDLKVGESTSDGEATMCSVRVPVQEPQDVRALSAWFSEFLQTSCRLVRVPDRWGDSEQRDSEIKSGSSFSNDAPLLLVNTLSFESVASRIPADEVDGGGSDISSFRANFVVAPAMNNDTNRRTLKPFSEDSWMGITVRIGETSFRCLGSCQRCTMICVDQRSGKQNRTMLNSLVQTPRSTGDNSTALNAKQKMNFGQFVMLQSDQVEWVAPGLDVFIIPRQDGRE
ncbi:pyridoxal phosphate-dependent transferase [Cladochytrium replicatum]|nr:pyridoxal phosphate-dependent transferase [Cladochytrium replicatum]